jgi:hypothetical protein
MESPLLAEIETFIAAHGLAETTFGQKALGDKHFVKQLRAGRDIRLSTAGRVKTFMLTYGAEAPQC